MTPNFLKNKEINLEKVRIESPRCIIEPFYMEWIDFSVLQKAFVSANKNFYINWSNPTIEEEKEFIKWAIKNRQDWKAFECYIFEKKTKTLVGSVWISNIDTAEPNLWLWICEEFHGQWYWTEAYEALLGWIKNNTNFVFFKHKVNPNNIASIRLAERFNWKLQEIVKEDWDLKYYIYI